MTPKIQAVQENTGELDYIQIQHFCVVKDDICRVRRQPREWEKIFSDHTSYKNT
jgi:hypothetical protein